MGPTPLQPVKAMLRGNTASWSSILPAGKNETFRRESWSWMEALYGGLSVAPRRGQAKDRGRPGTAARTD
jgi:hypothetical protein